MRLVELESTTTKTSQFKATRQPPLFRSTIQRVSTGLKRLNEGSTSREAVTGSIVRKGCPRLSNIKRPVFTMLPSQAIEFSSLPDEVVEHIFSWVYENTQNVSQNFLRLSLVCRSFHRIAQPFLYRRFSCDLHRQDPAAAAARVRIFLRHPERARLVQDVYMRGWRSRALGESFITENFDIQEQMQLRTWIDGANLYQNCWKLIDQGAADHLGALLISRFLNLKSLDIDGLDRTHREKYDRIMPKSSVALRTLFKKPLSSEEKLSDGLSTFQKLDTVRISADDSGINTFVRNKDDCYIYFESILALFYLPKIRTIELERIDKGPRKIWPTAPPKASILTTLVLEDCQLSENKLDMLLHASPKLKKLRCGIAYDAQYCKGWFKATRVRQSLDAVKKTLEHLDLSVTLWTSTALDIGDWGPWGVEGSLGSLKDFSCLTYLSLTWPVLLGWKVEGSATLADVLPESLQILSLTNDMWLWAGYQWDDEDDYDPWTASNSPPRWRTIKTKIKEYLESRPSRLEELIVDISPDDESDESDESKELKSSLEVGGQAVGINVKIII